MYEFVVPPNVAMAPFLEIHGQHMTLYQIFTMYAPIQGKDSPLLGSAQAMAVAVPEICNGDAESRSGCVLAAGSVVGILSQIAHMMWVPVSFLLE